MKQGAVGYITLESPRAGHGSYPFKTITANWDRARFTWAEADGSGHIPTPTAPGLGMLSIAGAAKLFEGAKVKWDDVAKRSTG